MIRPVRCLIAVAGILALPAAAAATPIIASASATPIGWNGSDQVTVRWQIANISAAQGMRLEIGVSDDGSADQGWSTLLTRGFTGPGQGEATVALGGREGRRAVRMVAWDETGTTMRFVDSLLLDRSAPHSRSVSLRRTPSVTTVSWQQDDGAGAGTARDGTIEVETAPGTWRSSPVAVGDGAMTAAVSLEGLAEGPYAARLRMTDRVGNVAVTPLPTLYVDWSAPTFSGVSVERPGGPESRAAQITYTTQDRLSGVPIGTPAEVVDIESGAVVAAVTSGPGRQAAVLDVPPDRPRSVVLRVHDAAGNVGVSRTIDIGPNGEGLAGAGSVTDPRERELRDARLGVRIGSATRAGVRTVSFGSSVTITGTLTSDDGKPLAATEIEVRDRAGAVLGRTLTRAGGAFRLRVIPNRSGMLRVGVPLGDGLLPAHHLAGTVRLVPRVTFRASSRQARAGGAAIVFRGRMQPSPRALGIAKKNVVLEWRDPVRGTWRPMVNTAVNADGRVSVAWRFGAGGFTVPVRMRVPAERGWPTAAGLSRAVSVSVQ